MIKEGGREREGEGERGRGREREREGEREVNDGQEKLSSTINVHVHDYYIPYILTSS